MPLSLKTEGDSMERDLFDSFIGPQFPEYELFWQKHIVPITNRPGDKQISVGADAQAVFIAQLHYTVLEQLRRCLHVKDKGDFTRDDLFFGLSALVGSQDVAFDLLQRFSNRTRACDELTSEGARMQDEAAPSEAQSLSE